MGKVLTFTSLIESGVVSRNESVGNISTLKKVMTHKGARVFFSDKTYKRAIWDNADRGPGVWKRAEVSPTGGVVQKISTIIDSEELDFSGTMVAKPFNYSRLSNFLPTYGFSENEYVHCLEFLTNMGLAKELGLGMNAIYNREMFKGLYKLSGLIDLDRVGVQEFEIPSQIDVASLDLEGASDTSRVFEAIYRSVAEQVKLEVAAAAFAGAFENVLQLEDIVPGEGKKANAYTLSFEILPVDADNGTEDEVDPLREILSGDKKDRAKKINAFLIEQLSEGMDDGTKGELKKIVKESGKGAVITGVDVKDDKCTIKVAKSIGKNTVKPLPEYLNDESDDIGGKLRWICNVFREALGFSEDPDEYVKRYRGRVENGGDIKIEKINRSYKVKIVLSTEERIRRVAALVRSMCELYRQLEGTYVNLTPCYSVWSTQLRTPVFHDIFKGPNGGQPSSWGIKEEDKEYIGPEENGNFTALYDDCRIYCGRTAKTFLDRLEKEVSDYYTNLQG